MTTLTVGTGAGDYASLGAALAASHDGDTVALPAGIYLNQTATVTDNITLQGVGGTATLLQTVPVANAMGILVVNASGTVTINNVAFIGAATSNANGANAAGIRYQGGNLVLNHDSFAYNQEGILATPSTAGTGTVTLNNSTVTGNGVSDPTLTSGYGYTHNLYINNVADFSITGSTITAANIGHEVKSRALSTSITNSIIADGPAGTASYGIDLPNAGTATIQGNTIQKGPAAQNPAVISNGEEGASNTGSLAVVGNTIVNNDASPYSVAVINLSTTAATITGNSITGLTASQIDANTADTVSGNSIGTGPTVAMQVQIDGTTIATGSATGTTLTTIAAGAGYAALSGIGTPGLSLDIAATGSGGHTARFVLSQGGFTANTAVASFFDTNTGLAGATITWSVYANADNAAFGTESLLGTASFIDYGVLVSASQGFALGFTPSGAYSLTELVTITPGALVPEPMSFVLLAAGMAGIALVRRRRRRLARRPG